MGVSGGCSSNIVSNASSAGGSGPTASSGTGHEGAGKSCGDWDASNAETPSPKCKPGTINPKCLAWVASIVPPNWPKLTNSCGVTLGADDACNLGVYASRGPSCAHGADGDAKCTAILQGFVRGTGQAFATCDCFPIDPNENGCDWSCNFSTCKGLEDGCGAEQICVTRPGHAQACETPCE